MRTITIVRHAEAMAQQVGQDDFSRPLTSKGAEQMKAQGSWLAQAGFVPDRVLVSPAKRAQSSWQLLSGALGEVKEVPTVPDLYEASGYRLLAQLQTLPDEVYHVMLVCHLPGVAQLLSLLATSGLYLEHHFSPGTVAMIEFEYCKWQKLSPGRGLLRLFLPPLY